MNLNKYMLFRNNEVHEKKHSYLTTPMNSFLSINDKYIKRKNADNSYYQTINNQSSNNNYTNQTTNNSYRIGSNISNITQDIRRHNNVIINNNNYKTLNKPLNIKKNSINFYKAKNPKNTPLNKYIKISNINKINRNNNKKIESFNTNQIINTSKNNFSNSNNYNSNVCDSEEIEYINMKLNFKLLEQKISHLNNIILPKDVYSSEYQNLTLNNRNYYKNIIKNGSSFDRNALQKFETDIYLNNNNDDQTKFSQVKNIENLKSYRFDKKANEKSNYSYNLKSRQDQDLIKRIHNSNYNIYKEHLVLQKEFEYLNNLQNRNGIENGGIKNNVIEDINELNDIYYNTVDIKNEIIPDKNYTKQAYSFNIPSKQFTHKIISMDNNLNKANNIKSNSNNISNLSNNTTNNNKSENYKITNLSEIIYNADNKSNNKEKNFKTSDLIVQSVFSYNHNDNKSKIENKESINISKAQENKNETEKEIVNDDNKEINNNKNDEVKDENYDDESEKEGEKVINSLLAQVSKNTLDKKNILMILNKGKNETNLSNNNNNDNINDVLSPNNKEETDNSSNKNNINIIKNKKKKVTFDEKLIYINYNEKEKVTKLKIIEGNKTSQFKPKDLTEYINILSLSTTDNQIKPILIDRKSVV